MTKPWKFYFVQRIMYTFVNYHSISRDYQHISLVICFICCSAKLITENGFNRIIIELGFCLCFIQFIFCWLNGYCSKHHVECGLKNKLAHRFIRNPSVSLYKIEEKTKKITRTHSIGWELNSSIRSIFTTLACLLPFQLNIITGRSYIW